MSQDLPALYVDLLELNNIVGVGVERGRDSRSCSVHDLRVRIRTRHGPSLDQSVESLENLFCVGRESCCLQPLRFAWTAYRRAMFFAKAAKSLGMPSS